MLGVCGWAAAQNPPVPSENKSVFSADAVTDAMRTAPVFEEYGLTVHLEPPAQGLEAEARLTVRNAGAVPLAILPLQLSSGLKFTEVRTGGKPLRFAAHRVDSDADHTGALTEAAVELPAPLAPGARIALTVEYEGAVRAESGRLERAQASAKFARSSDWDQVSEEFTALRGFGNTVWYPASSVPALLGEGLARETARQRAANAGAAVRLSVTDEFTGHAPNTLAVDGEPVDAPEPASLPTATFPGVLRFSWAGKLGAEPLSLLAAARNTAERSTLVTTAALGAHIEAADAYGAGASLVEPLFTDWFGGPPKPPLLAVDVPADGALPFAQGGALLLGFVNGVQPTEAARGLLTPLAHAYFRSPRLWLREGVAGLMEALWTERTEGRAQALAQIGAGRAGLALREPATPGAGGEPLLIAEDVGYARAKGVYVLWMLRALAGDDALKAALRAYRAEADTEPGYFEALLARSLGPDRPDAGKDLHAFFENWVYGDPGLPDLAIRNVAPSHSGSGGQWLVAVEAENTGYADAWAPLTVRSADAAETVLLRVPARGTVSRRVLLPDEPTEVELNDGSVPEVSAGAHRRLLTEAAPAR